MKREVDATIERSLQVSVNGVVWMQPMDEINTRVEEKPELLACGEFCYRHCCCDFIVTLVSVIEHVFIHRRSV